MIEVRGLVKRFGLKPVLRGLNLEVGAGESLALVGPNGAGKTTLLRILTGLSRPTAGAVRVAGFPVPGGEDAIRARLGVVAHQSMLYGELTAQENLRFFGRMYGMEDLQGRIEATLELVGLERVRHERVRAFSRGMQQRLAIARAVMHRPPILLLDEPHTGLDQRAAATLDQLLREVTEMGRTVVMTTHDLPLAHRLADRIDVLSHGVISASVATHQVGIEELITRYDEATGV